MIKRKRYVYVLSTQVNGLWTRKAFSSLDKAKNYEITDPGVKVRITDWKVWMHRHMLRGSYKNGRGVEVVYFIDRELVN